MAKATLTYRDYSQELSTVQFYTSDVAIGGGNWDTVTGSIEALAALTNVITLCVEASESFTQKLDPDDNGIPASPWAQRELGIRVFYSDDDNGRKYHLTIPGPNLQAIETLGNSDEIDLSATEMAAWVVGFEAVAKSQDGNSVTVDRAVIVGRRS